MVLNPTTHILPYFWHPNININKLVISIVNLIGSYSDKRSSLSLVFHPKGIQTHLERITVIHVFGLIQTSSIDQITVLRDIRNCRLHLRFFKIVSGIIVIYGI